MNRRSFLTGTIATAALLPTAQVAALDIDFIKNPIVQIFDMLPDFPASERFDFPVTTGTLGTLQRNVWPENPEMYWDPEGEDFYTVFGFYPTWMDMQGFQDGVSLWQMNTSAFDRDASQAVLESNNWEIVDDDLSILHYTGSENDRKTLATSLNILGSWMLAGDWDWVALPDDASIVIGSDEERVRIVADRVKNHSVMTTIAERYPHIGKILRHDAYLVSLLPYQRLPVQFSNATFVSRSWTGDEPIIHSIGLQIESADNIPSMIDAVQGRLESETSSLVGSEYANFLTITKVSDYRKNVRFDFVDASGVWDVFLALRDGDLGMLPLLTDDD